MDVILRRTDNSSFILFPSYFYLLSSLLLFSCLIIRNEKILCPPRRFDVKTARNTDKANSKIF